MSKHFSITTSDGTTISATSCGEYRAEFGAPYRCDISLEAGDFYADLEEVGDTDEIVDQLEERGVLAGRGRRAARRNLREPRAGALMATVLATYAALWAVGGVPLLVMLALFLGVRWLVSRWKDRTIDEFLRHDR